MLKVDECWNKIENSNCFWDNELHNMQEIKEQLLRLTTKWTDMYATDILIFFEYFNKYFLEGNITEIDFYFRNSGVNWVLLDKNGKHRYIVEALEKYIGCAKLVFDGKDMTLYWKTGNI